MVSPSALLLALATIASAVAHPGRGCGGHGFVNKRNPGGPLREFVPRAVTDEASAAASEDPSYQCTPYSYQPVLNIKANYPTIWQTASILSSDTEAQSVFATINATVNAKLPNDLPKGTSTGNFTGVAYNATDPDCWWTWKQCTTPSSDLGIAADITVMPEPETWGLGFDDGPNCSHNALYDLLAQNNQKATMFYIGSNVMDWPLQAMRGITDGHQICVHTWSHQYMTSFSNDVAFAELWYTRKAIKDVLGVTPLCWRPPFGDVDNRIRLIAAGLNLTTIVWNEDTDDWKAGTGNVTTQDVDNNYQKFISQGTDGTYATYGPIVLNHELNNFTMSEMVKYYSQIKSAYKYVVPVAVGLNVTHPYVETNYTYPTFAEYVAGTTNVTIGASNSTGGTFTSAAAPSGSASASASPSSSAKSGSAGLSFDVSGGLVAVAGLIGAVASTLL